MDWDDRIIIEAFELTSTDSWQCLRLCVQKYSEPGPRANVNYQIYSRGVKGDENKKWEEMKSEKKQEIIHLRYKPDLMRRSLRAYVPTMHITNFYSGFVVPRNFRLPFPRMYSTL